ncbi:MAG: hypothetical protein JG780_1574 [Thermosipho sp. (in: Bacteria)]|jgi:hypothetical protein|nr:hypothetical protein [Thermosipho sp. (in: thermotogales)]
MKIDIERKTSLLLYGMLYFLLLLIFYLNKYSRSFTDFKAGGSDFIC